MTFTYTELLKNASPLRGGQYATFAMGDISATSGAVHNLVSTTLASVVHATVNVYGAHQTSACITSVSSNGMITIAVGAACSGSWTAFGN